MYVWCDVDDASFRQLFLLREEKDAERERRAKEKKEPLELMATTATANNHHKKNINAYGFCLTLGFPQIQW